MLCQNARNKLKGNSNKVLSPLPRRPPNRIPSNLNPRGVTRRCSMPSGLPNQETCHPSVRKYSATANPGKIWPPVPPAITNRDGDVD